MESVPSRPGPCYASARSDLLFFQRVIVPRLNGITPQTWMFTQGGSHRSHTRVYLLIILYCILGHKGLRNVLRAPLNRLGSPLRRAARHTTPRHADN